MRSACPAKKNQTVQLRIQAWLVQILYCIRFIFLSISHFSHSASTKLIIHKRVKSMHAKSP